MSDFIIVALVIVIAVVVVFSKAMECYFCGSRSVTSRSKLGTRGLCNKCRNEGKELP